MKAASLKQIKDEVQSLGRDEISNHLFHLMRFKKENKELLTYLLFYKDDEQSYINEVKREVEEGFTTINFSSYYLAKKTIRKILKSINKYIRYSKKANTKIDLHIHFCFELSKMELDFRKNLVLKNMYMRQLNSIEKTVAKLHSDFQMDYQSDIDSLKQILIE